MTPKADTPDGRYILNTVQRPTTPFNPAPGIADYAATLSGKKSFVELHRSDTPGEIVVKSLDGTTLGTMTESSYAVYGDVIEQIIDDGLAPCVECTIEVMSSHVSSWLHFRQDVNDLTWGQYKPRRQDHYGVSESTKAALRESRRVLEEIEAKKKLRAAHAEFEKRRKTGLLAKLRKKTTCAENRRIWEGIAAEFGVPVDQMPQSFFS